jgi:hypothetical protein
MTQSKKLSRRSLSFWVNPALQGINEMDIDLTGSAEGVYFVQVKGKNHGWNGKIIKE